MGFERFSVDIVIPLYNNFSALYVLSRKIESWIDSYPRSNVFIIDDGSPQQDHELVPAIVNKDRVTYIRHSKNLGRAAARNTGFRAGESDFVVFLDVDCFPQEGWLARFFQGVESGSDFIFGNLRAEGTSYWSKYLNELYQRRASAFRRGSRDFTTPFCMVRRELLSEIGGFNEAYIRYGFEDRDLVQSLINLERISPMFLEDVYASHGTPGSIESVMTKATESGEFSAQIFSSRFPEYYRNTGYWFFDAREHSLAYCFPLAIMWKLIDKHGFAIKTLLDKEALPYFVWKWLVKIFSVLAFFHGTNRSN
jgi:glycosyltransferase involved in cell wall biosynthesis